jgi:hypothetical protein
MHLENPLLIREDKQQSDPPKMNRNHRTTIITLSFFAVLISWFTLDDETLSVERFKGGIIGLLINVRFFFMHALLAGIVLYSVIRLIKKRVFGYFFPLIICLIHFTVLITIRTKKYLRESSPIVLKADFFDEINGLTLYLRQNKTYKLSDYGFYGGANHYGEYQIIGDTILLSEKHPLGTARDIMSNKLVMRNGFVLIKPDSTGTYQEGEWIKLRIIK